MMVQECGQALDSSAILDLSLAPAISCKIAAKHPIDRTIAAETT
jgi:hypothetical protein